MSQTCTVDGCDRPVLDAYVCQACALDLERALGDVRWLNDQLDVVLTRQTAKPERVGGTSTEQALPYDPRATEARWVLANTVTTWARVVEEEHNEANPPIGPTHAVCHDRSCAQIRGVHPPNIGGIGILAAWLSSYAGWLRTHAAGADAVEEVLSCVGAARRLVDVRPERWYAGPCEGPEGERCGHDLYARPNAAHVTCPACGSRWETQARRDALLKAAWDHLGTASEVSALCRAMLGQLVTVDMIRGYVRRGVIAAHGSGLDRRGRMVALYRIGDVIDTAQRVKYDEREERATRRAGRTA